MPTMQAAAQGGAVELPPSLRNNVAVLHVPNAEAPGGRTDVYLLAMSHVSKKSVQQVIGACRCRHGTCAQHRSRRPRGTTTAAAIHRTSTHALPQVKDLIRLVKPEVVGVELCKDRIPLLIDNEADTLPNIWHCRRVRAACSGAALRALRALHSMLCAVCCGVQRCLCVPHRPMWPLLLTRVHPPATRCHPFILPPTRAGTTPHASRWAHGCDTRGTMPTD